MNRWFLAILPLLLSVKLDALEMTIRATDKGARIALESGGLAEGVQIFLMMTAVALLPMVFILCTSFTRILIVLALLRQALGIMQVPPNPVLIGLAVFLTFFTMAPVATQLEQQVVKPVMENKITLEQGIKDARKPLADFLFAQVRESDLELFINLSGITVPQNRDEVPVWVLVPAFIISELKTAFKIGFLIYIPFLVVDIMIASVLMSMGLMMLPPTIFGVPLKLLLFVMVDGWSLIVTNLIRSFQL